MRFVLLLGTYLPPIRFSKKVLNSNNNLPLKMVLPSGKRIYSPLAVKNVLNYLRNACLEHRSQEKTATNRRSNRTQELKLERCLFTVAMPQIGIYDFGQFILYT